MNARAAEVRHGEGGGREEEGPEAGEGREEEARSPAKRRAPISSVLFAPIEGATRTDLAGVRLEVARAGAARVKRLIYPAGFRWSVVGGQPAVLIELDFENDTVRRLGMPDAHAHA